MQMVASCVTRFAKRAKRITFGNFVTDINFCKIIKMVKHRNNTTPMINDDGIAARIKTIFQYNDAILWCPNNTFWQTDHVNCLVWIAALVLRRANRAKITTYSLNVNGGTKSTAP